MAKLTSIYVLPVELPDRLVADAKEVISRRSGDHAGGRPQNVHPCPPPLVQHDRRAEGPRRIHRRARRRPAALNTPIDDAINSWLQRDSFKNCL